MPRVAQMIPASRFFARLDRFQCECPHCGHIITAACEITAPLRLRTIPQARGAAKLRPRVKSILDLIWNPYAQRLRCPRCQYIYVAGLVLYSPHRGARRVLDAPPDAVPTRREIAELRTQGKGWWADHEYRGGEPVNLSIDSVCTCPPRGWAVACRVHGDPVQARADASSDIR